MSIPVWCLLEELEMDPPDMTILKETTRDAYEGEDQEAKAELLEYCTRYGGTMEEYTTTTEGGKNGGYSAMTDDNKMDNNTVFACSCGFECELTWDFLQHLESEHGIKSAQVDAEEWYLWTWLLLDAFRLLKPLVTKERRGNTSLDNHDDIGV